MQTTPEPAFAWYQLQGREAALLLATACLLIGLSGAVFLTRDEPAPPAAKSADMPPAMVHVNRAGVAELSSLPGIGTRKAERIIESRKAAPIRSMDELARAAGGIPQASRERMAPFVRFED